MGQSPQWIRGHVRKTERFSGACGQRKGQVGLLLNSESQSGLGSGPFGFSVCGESMGMYSRFSSSQSGSVLCTNSCEVIRPDIQSLD